VIGRPVVHSGSAEVSWPVKPPEVKVSQCCVLTLAVCAAASTAAVAASAAETAA
jgi:hypothetical protein